MLITKWMVIDSVHELKDNDVSGIPMVATQSGIEGLPGTFIFSRKTKQTILQPKLPGCTMRQPSI